MREEGIFLPVIAKIEKPQAIDNIEEIVDAFDGFMVARGDLGVECPLEDVPFLQKQVIEVARRHAKPVIVATQMLESMISSPAAHPGRGLRRRQRGARRRRRGDAVRRDQRGGVPHRDRRDDGPDHRVHRGPRPRPDGRHRLAAAHPRRRDRQGGCRGRRAGRREVPRRVHPERRLRAPAVALPRPDPDAGVHARARRCARSWRCRGASRRSSAAPVEHTDEMVRQVDEHLLRDRPGRGGRPGGDHRGQPPGHPGLDQRAAHPPDGRRDQRGRPGLPRPQ